MLRRLSFTKAVYCFCTTVALLCCSNTLSQRTLCHEMLQVFIAKLEHSTGIAPARKPWEGLMLLLNITNAFTKNKSIRNYWHCHNLIEIWSDMRVTLPLYILIGNQMPHFSANVANWSG